MAGGRPGRGDAGRGSHGRSRRSRGRRSRQRQDLRLAPGWRLFDARVPRTQAARRLRALGLLGTFVILVSALVDVLSRPPGDQAAALSVEPPTTTTTSAPPATIQPLPSTPGMAPVITRVATTDPVVFLTIDDGHTRTPEVADAFAEVGAPASLFLLDAPVAQGAAFFRQLDGTVVQAHTQNHPDLPNLSEARQREEICRNAALIEDVFGQRPVLLRPPFGNYNEPTRRAAAACGMKAIVLWEASIDGDTISFRHTPRLRPGDIILLHFRPQFRLELETAVRHVERAGLRVALLEDYLAPEMTQR